MTVTDRELHPVCCSTCGHEILGRVSPNAYASELGPCCIYLPAPWPRSNEDEEEEQQILDDALRCEECEEHQFFIRVGEDDNEYRYWFDGWDGPTPVGSVLSVHGYAFGPRRYNDDGTMPPRPNFNDCTFEIVCSSCGHVDDSIIVRVV